MTYFQAVILAVIQGLTEFLPVSSSGHLVIFQHLFHLEPPVFFDVAVHIGTLGSILVYFRRELIGHIGRTRFISLIIVGSLPAAVVGLLLQSRIETIFSSLPLVGLSLLVTAGLLISTKRRHTSEESVRPPRGSKEENTPGEVTASEVRYQTVPDETSRAPARWDHISWVSALLVGLAQAVAILPGVSRSGATIVAGLHRGLDRQTAFRFSFFLAIPAILGALVLQLPDVFSGQFNYLNQALVGSLVAGVIGYFSLKTLEKVLLKAKLWWFGVYCLFIAVGIAILTFTGIIS